MAQGEARRPDPDGGHEKKSVGPAKLIDDLQAIEWKKRTVYVCFDSDVAGKKHASAFKQSKYAGAWGAEFVLAELLRAQGADVRIVEIPDDDSGEKVGADDYIAKNGHFAFLKLLWNNWTAQRDVDAVLYRANAEALVFVEARELARVKPPRPVFVIDRLLPEGGTMIVAAAPKVGKSGIALNAAKAVGDRGGLPRSFPGAQGALRLRPDGDPGLGDGRASEADGGLARRDAHPHAGQAQAESLGGGRVSEKT